MTIGDNPRRGLKKERQFVRQWQADFHRKTTVTLQSFKKVEGWKVENAVQWLGWRCFKASLLTRKKQQDPQLVRLVGGGPHSKAGTIWDTEVEPNNKKVPPSPIYSTEIKGVRSSGRMLEWRSQSLKAELTWLSLVRMESVPPVGQKMVSTRRSDVFEGTNFLCLQ